MAAAYTDLIAGANGVSAETAADTIAEARVKVDSLQGTLRMFSGVDAARERALLGAGVSGPPDLANADAAELESKLGTGSMAYVRRLIDEARSAVPPEQWKPGENVGLKDHEVAALNRAGVRSLGDLQRAADPAKPAEFAKVKAALGATDEVVNGLAGRIAVDAGETFRAKRLGAAPLTALTGVTEDVGTKLSAGGLRSIHDLSSAKVEDVAASLGGNELAAKSLINAAREKSGMRPIR
jgi:hypothetical protein